MSDAKTDAILSSVVETSRNQTASIASCGRQVGKLSDRVSSLADEVAELKGALAVKLNTNGVNDRGDEQTDRFKIADGVEADLSRKRQRQIVATALLLAKGLLLAATGAMGHWLYTLAAK